MSESLDRAALAGRQLAALHRLLTAVLAGNPFYRQKLAAAGVTAPPATLADFFRTVPPTTKAEIVADQRDHPPFGSNLTYPLERYTRYSQTSGTTGRPLRWLDTPESWEWMVANWLVVFRASGVGPGDRIMFAFSFGPFLGFWTSFDAGQRLGCLCIPGGGMSSAARLATIFEAGCTVLCCTPTYAIRLGEVAQEVGIDLARAPVQRILVAGEPGAAIPATRTRLEALWPTATLRDHHGMTEVGPVTYECPVRRGVLHVIETAYIAEINDVATGQPVPPGEIGELWLTPLGRIGSPLIRYRTGDLVRAARESPCACGRYELALEGGILGRSDDMVIVRGVNLYPAAVEAIVRQFPAVAEYRVEVDRRQALPEVRIEIEPLAEAGDPDGLARAVAKALRDALHLRVPVTAVAPGSLPRFEFKARRWVEIGAADGERA